jgi:hypothetical protein
MQNKEKANSKGNKSIVILLLALGLFILVVNFLPGQIRYRPKSYCSRVESDASNIAASIADHFSDPKHLDIKRNDIEAIVTIDNPWTFTRCGLGFFIHVVDRSGKCPVEYQNNRPEWNSGIYTLRMGSD